ncbi:MAG: hypothetical protein AAF086_05705 [Planctomycetota bacterium]
MLSPGSWLGLNGVAAVLLGLALGGVVLAGWGFWGRRARGHRRCRGCGYDLRGVEGLGCSECGRVASSEKELLKPRRRPWAMMVGLTVAVNAAGLLYGPLVTLRHEQYGESWLEALVPTTLRILMLPHVELDQWEKLERRDPAWANINLTLALSSTSSGGGAAHPWDRLEPVYMMDAGIFGRRGPTPNGYNWASHRDFLEIAPHGLLGLQVSLLRHRLIGIAQASAQSSGRRGTALLWLGDESAGLSVDAEEALRLLNDPEPHLRGASMQVISQGGMDDPRILDRLVDWLDPRYSADPVIQREEAIDTLFNLGIPAAERVWIYLHEIDSQNKAAWDLLLKLASDNDLPGQSRAVDLLFEAEANFPTQAKTVLPDEWMGDLYWAIEGSGDPVLASWAKTIEKRLDY